MDKHTLLGLRVDASDSSLLNRTIVFKALRLVRFSSCHSLIPEKSIVNQILRLRKDFGINTPIFPQASRFGLA